MNSSNLLLFQGLPSSQNQRCFYTEQHYYIEIIEKCNLLPEIITDNVVIN